MTEAITVVIPDPGIVSRAIQGLDGVRPDAAWEVVRTKEHRNSSIAYIDVHGSTATVRLVYKTRAYMEDGWLSLNLRLSAAAASHLEAEGMNASPILAADEASRVVVTRYLPGRKLRPPDPSQRALSEVQSKTYRDVGRACRILESVAPPFSDSDAKEALWRRFQNRLASSNFGPGFAVEVERFAAAALDSATAGANPIVMTHHDMTFNNVVVDGETTGLIDLGFAPSLKGHAVTKMLHRLSFANRWVTAATTEAIDAVLEGYGPWDSEDGMKFFRVHRLVGLLAGSGWRSTLTPRLRRARSDLRALIAESETKS